MTPRTKVLALLLGMLTFMATAGAVKLAMRVHAGAQLSRVAQRDVPLLALTAEVSASHLEQAIRLERAFRHSRRRDASPEASAAYQQARAEYETYATAIWRRLREARAVADRAAAEGDPEAARLAERIAHLDAAHNAYAELVRSAFALLEEGRRSEAIALSPRVTAEGDALAQTLGALLAEASASAETEASRARGDERLTSGVVWSLLGAALLAAIGVSVMVVRQVSEMRTLTGLLPICAHCKKIRDDDGYWNQLEAYLEAHSDAAFTHGICAGCQADLHAKTVASARDRSSGSPNATSAPSPEVAAV